MVTVTVPMPGEETSAPLPRTLVQVAGAVVVPPPPPPPAGVVRLPGRGADVVRAAPLGALPDGPGMPVRPGTDAAAESGTSDGALPAATPSAAAGSPAEILVGVSAVADGAPYFAATSSAVPMIVPSAAPVALRIDGLLQISWL